MSDYLRRIEALKELSGRHWSRKSLAELDDGLAEAIKMAEERDESRIKLRLILLEILEKLEGFTNGGL